MRHRLIPLEGSNCLQFQVHIRFTGHVHDHLLDRAAGESPGVNPRVVGRHRGAGAAAKSALTEVEAIKSTLLRSSAPATLRDEARRLELELKTLTELMNGNERRDLYGDTGPVSIGNRIQPARMGTFRSTYGPTTMHRQSLEIAETAFDQVKARLSRVIDSDLPALRAQLDANKVPWTPGRGVPGGD
mgnify:CR=1 FL=1